MALKVHCGNELLPDSSITEATLTKSTSSSHGMSTQLQLTWGLAFAAMLFIAIGGNIMVIWSVFAHRRMRTVTNYFLVNLSLADLFMALFNCMFNFIYMINNDWYFGEPYCTVNNYVANVTVAASVFTLTSITIDRYLAIVTPLKPRMSKSCAQLTIIGIWVASLFVGFPCLLYSTTITYKMTGQTACIMKWPDGHPMESTLDYIYNVVLFMVTYMVPMSAMVCCYTAMGRTLWGSRSIGEMTQRQVESIRSKRKVVRMFLLIVSVFGVCWLPYHFYFIYTHHVRDFVYSKYVQHLYLGFYWLAMANAMMNPLIYYFMNARFRQYFREAICEWHCFDKRPTPVDGVETPPLRRYSHSYSRSGTENDSSGTANDRFHCRSTNLTSSKHFNNGYTTRPNWKDLNEHVIVAYSSHQCTTKQRPDGDGVYLSHSWTRRAPVLIGSKTTQL